MNRLIAGASVVLTAAASFVAVGVARAAGTASISGTVRDAVTGAPIAGMGVQVLRDEQVATIGGHPIVGPVDVADTTTGPNGTYSVSGLDANAPGYYVCFAGDLLGPVSSYQFQCYHDAPFYSPFPNPLGLVQVAFGSLRVPLTAGQHVGGIDADMFDQAASTSTISGHVRAGSAPLGDVTVVAASVIAPAARLTTRTAPDGSYSLDVPPGNYFVCFDAHDATGGTSTTGYAGECNQNVPWPTSSALPAGIVPVTVDGNATVNASLDRAGAIAGRVSQRLLQPLVPGMPLVGVTVDVFGSDGFVFTSGVTVKKGLYRINGLVPGATYKVCFDPAGAHGGITVKSYRAQCYLHVVWQSVTGPPAPGATSISVTSGAVRTGVDEALPA